MTAREVLEAALIELSK
jgi:hypothetical protein